MDSKPSKEHLRLSLGLILGIFCLLSSAAIALAKENLLSNPGFEEVADDMPLGWQIEQKNMHKGTISIDQENIQSGHYALELIPNSKNIGTHDLLGVGQAVDATPYRGKSLTISGWMAAIDKRLIDGFLDGLAWFVRTIANFWERFADRQVVDGFVNGLANLTYRTGAGLRQVQTGRLRQYVMFIAVGTVAVFLLVTFVWNYAFAG